MGLVDRTYPQNFVCLLIVILFACVSMQLVFDEMHLDARSSVVSHSRHQIAV